MKSVFLFTLDCLRYDALGKNTPNINKLIQDSIFYKKSISSGSNTPNSMAPILTGISSMQFQNARIPIRCETIASYLLKNGYNTIGLNQGNAWCSEFFGFDKGFNLFNSYLDKSNMNDAKQLGISNNKYLNNKKIYKINTFYEEFINMKQLIINEIQLQNKFFFDTLKQIDTIEDNTFFWTHFMVNHWPRVTERITIKDNIHYNRIYPYMNVNKSQEVKMKYIYNMSIKEIDRYIGKIIYKLKKKKIYKDSLIILTSDHGELLGEYDRHSHPSIIVKELIHVPLIIKYPNKKQIGVYNDYINNNNIIKIIKNINNNESPHKNISKICVTANFKHIDAFDETIKNKENILINYCINSKDVYIIIENNKYLLYDKNILAKLEPIDIITNNKIFNHLAYVNLLYDKEKKL